MTLHTVQILLGDVRNRLRDVPDASIDCCVTSPPYWGLRDYGVDGQIGLEPSPAEFVDALVAVFREVRRALKDDGTLWLNLGDSYSGSSASGSASTSTLVGTPNALRDGCGTRSKSVPHGLKPKDLVGIPWRVAFALQADGWYLRSDIIWHKPNPMPESVADRPTKAHEYVFLLSKSERYRFDADAIAEKATGIQCGNTRPIKGALEDPVKHRTRGNLHKIDAKETRNARSVWTIPTQPFSGAHFATFPEELAKRCIVAGCPIGGTVLDPFFGAGTVGLVAVKNGCNAVGVELNPEYASIAANRIRCGVGMLATVDVLDAKASHAFASEASP